MNRKFAPDAMNAKLFSSFLDSHKPLYVGFSVLLALLIAIFGFVEERNKEYEYIHRLMLERDALNLVFNALLNAETGQRGYLLTGNPIYLEPYRYGITSVDSGLREIET